jgi:hypothetical protein
MPSFTFFAAAYLSATDTNNQPVRVAYPTAGNNTPTSIYYIYYSAV